MEVVKAFVGPLEFLVRNQKTKQKSVRFKLGADDNREVGGRIEEKKPIFKGNFAVFSLENVDPANCFEKNCNIEMDEDNFWEYVFSDKWLDYRTLRLNSGPVLKDLFIQLDDLLAEGCIDSETIIHFDDNLSLSDSLLTDENSKYRTARIQIKIYKWPEFKFCIETNEAFSIKTSQSDENSSESDDSRSLTQRHSKEHGLSKLLQNLSLSVLRHSKAVEDEEEELEKEPNFDAFYFPKSFFNSTSRTLHDSVESYLKNRLQLKKSKHWTERPEEYIPFHFLESKDDSNRHGESFATKTSAENKKSIKAKKKDNKEMVKSSKISAPISEQSAEVNESKSIETEIEKILSREPLWISFEKKMNKVLDGIPTTNENNDDRTTKMENKSKQKKGAKNVKKEIETLPLEKQEIPAKVPVKPQVVAKISYADERIPVLVTKEKKRCPDTIVLKGTCRSETLWSLPTPARFKCKESTFHSLPWRSVTPLECQSFKEDLRSHLQDDLTQLWNLGRDNESSSSEDAKNAEETKPESCFIPFKWSRKREDRNSCRSIIKREIKKINSRKKSNKSSIDEQKLEEVQSSPSLEPSSFLPAAMGFTREKPGEYLLAAMRKYQVRKETVSVSLPGGVETVTCLTFNRPWRNNFTLCCQ